jgi:arsenate reductase (glutaredoxin)
MKRIYHLSTCSTCKKIIHEIQPTSDVQLIDIKQEQIDTETLDWLKSKTGSYEALFSKRAIKFRELSPNDIPIQDTDFRKLLLEEYTFLKRPVCIDGENFSIGNTKNEVAKAIQFYK